MSKRTATTNRVQLDLFGVTDTPLWSGTPTTVYEKPYTAAAAPVVADAPMLPLVDDEAVTCPYCSATMWRMGLDCHREAHPFPWEPAGYRDTELHWCNSCGAERRLAWNDVTWTQGPTPEAREAAWAANHAS